MPTEAETFLASKTQPLPTVDSVQSVTDQLQLRAKIEDNSAALCLVPTKPGVGDRFVADN
jgi:hypothetical protein